MKTKKTARRGST